MGLEENDILGAHLIVSERIMVLEAIDNRLTLLTDCPITSLREEMLGMVLGGKTVQLVSLSDHPDQADIFYELIQRAVLARNNMREIITFPRDVSPMPIKPIQTCVRPPACGAKPKNGHPPASRTNGHFD